MRNTLILAAVLAVAPSIARAESLSYTFIEAGYSRLSVNVDDTDDHMGGGYLRGAYQFADSTYLFTSFTQARKTYRQRRGNDTLSDQLTVRQPEIGIGYRHQMSARTDFIAELAYLRIDAKDKATGYDAYLGANDIDGTYGRPLNLGRVGIGVRGKPSTRTEAWIKASYIDGRALEDGEFVAALGAQVNAGRTWSVVGELQFLDDTLQTLLGVRASF